MSKELSIVFNTCLDFLGSGLLDKGRKNDSTFKRAIYYKLAKELTDDTLRSIGAYTNRDHSTVLHGLRVFDEQIKCQSSLKVYYQIYERVRAKCHSRLYCEGLSSLSKEDKMFHHLINQRERIDQLEKILEKIPNTVKVKYA